MALREVEAELEQLERNSQYLTIVKIERNLERNSGVQPGIVS